MFGVDLSLGGFACYTYYWMFKLLLTLVLALADCSLPLTGGLAKGTPNSFKGLMLLPSADLDLAISPSYCYDCTFAMSSSTESIPVMYSAFKNDGTSCKWLVSCVDYVTTFFWLSCLCEVVYTWTVCWKARISLICTCYYWKAISTAYRYSRSTLNSSLRELIAYLSDSISRLSESTSSVETAGCYSCEGGIGVPSY